MAVLDASAVLAVLLNEPGKSEVIPWLDGGLLSVVNLAEVVGRMARQYEATAVRAAIGHLGLVLMPPPPDIGLAAGLWESRTRPYGLSLGDRFCLALAISSNLPAITADRQWQPAGVDLGVEVILIR